MISFKSIISYKREFNKGVQTAMKKILDFFYEHKTFIFILRFIFIFCLYFFMIPFMTDIINNIYVLFGIILAIFIISQLIICIYNKDKVKKKKMIRNDIILIFLAVIFAVWFSYTEYGNFDGTNYYYPAQIVMQYEKRSYKKGSEQDKLCRLSDEMFSVSFENNGAFDYKYKDIISEEDFKKLDIGSIMDKKQNSFFNRNVKLKDTYEKMGPILTSYDEKYAAVWVGTDHYVIENEKGICYYTSVYRQIKYKKIGDKYKVIGVRDEKESYKENKMIHKRLKDMGRIEKTGYYDDILDIDDDIEDGYSEHLDYILKYKRIDTEDKDILKIKDDIYKLAKDSYSKRYDDTLKNKIDKDLYDKLSSKSDIKQEIKDIKNMNEDMNKLYIKSIEADALLPIITQLNEDSMTLWIKKNISIEADNSGGEDSLYANDSILGSDIERIYQVKVKIIDKDKIKYRIESVKTDYEAEKEINLQYNRLKNRK